MRIQEYKEMLVNQDLRQLDRELELFELFNKLLGNKESLGYKVSEVEGELTENSIDIEGLGKFTYFTYKRRKDVRFLIKTNNGSKSSYSLIYLARYQYLKLLKSYDKYLLDSYGLGKTKDELIAKINKDWDKYFIKLEQSLASICGEKLEEVVLNNYSNNFKQNNATVFGGNEGRAIIWTTNAGGHNIQQEHIRMFCKKLTNKHIKEFGIQF